MSKDQWPGGHRVAIARFVIRGVARLVPAGRRDEWQRTWEGDLWELASDSGSRGPGLGRFVAGTLPAALSELGAEWGPTTIGRDVARGWRRWTSAPLHAAFAVLIMVIAISANTSIFSIVNATLIRVPPYIVEPNQLAQIGRLKTNGDFDSFSYPNYADIRDQNTAFSGVAAYGRTTRLGRTPAGIVPLPVDAVSANFFEVLGSRPAVGRPFVAADEAAHAAVAVVSDTLCRRHFGEPSTALGQTLLLEDVPFTIIGVAPAGFIGADVAGPAPEAWIPLLSYDALLAGGRSAGERGFSWLSLIGRLAPGISVDRARASMQALHLRLAREYAGTLGTDIGVVGGIGLHPDERAEATRVSALLMSIVGTVLLIAGANLAGLLVAQASRRQRELTVCAALGASSLRLTRELLAEQVFVAVIGAVGSWALTWWTAKAVQSLLPYNLAVTIAPDWRVFVFGVVVAVVTSVAFGAVPARRAARVDIVSGLRAGAPGAGPLRMPSRWMAAAELALTFVLLIGAGLLIRSVVNARAADPGFEVDSIAAVQINLELVQRRSEDAAVRAAQHMLDLAAELPGVRRVALASHPPLLVPQRTRSLRMPPAGFTDPPMVAAVNAVSPGFLATLNLTLLRGRDFTDRDGERRGAEAAIVSETLARLLWPGTDPIGQRLAAGGDAEIIGVVSDVKLRSLIDRNLAAVYVPLASERPTALTLFVDTAGDPARTATQVDELVRAADPDVVITAAGPLRDLLSRTYGEARLVATLLIVFGGIAALLAAAGLYVVLASWVWQRRGELAVRLALGATPAQLRRLVFQRAALPAGAGLIAGALLAVAATRLLSGVLFGVGPLDPITYGCATVLLLTVALAAGCVPARRAVRADPIETLKGVY